MALKVLLPVDRSRNSVTAENYARKFHQQVPLSVTLLTVINEKTLDDRGIGRDLREKIHAQLRERCVEVLEEAAEPLRKDGVPVELRLETGLPGPTICRIAKQEGFDMVFITESGYSELGELLQGSVVSYVSHRCRVPVLLLKHGRD